MRDLALLGITVLGVAGGAIIGFALGAREGGDFNFAPLYTTPVGALIGGGIALAGALVMT